MTYEVIMVSAIAIAAFLQVIGKYLKRDWSALFGLLAASNAVVFGTGGLMNNSMMNNFTHSDITIDVLFLVIGAVAMFYLWRFKHVEFNDSM